MSVYEFCITSYEGTLNKANVDNKTQFYIDTYTGAGKIKCVFSDDLVGKATKAVGRKVCITGKAAYLKSSNFPHLIDATGIDVYPNDADLADWDDLHGVAPNATGELLSEEFIANFRDEWN